LISFVLDASTAVSWCFEEVQTPYALGVLDLVSEGAEVYVPHIWRLETNTLVKAPFEQVISLAERYHLTTYDASYSGTGSASRTSHCIR
jgi:predicted nucleic acid-binding protein